LRVTEQGTDVMILKIFSPKNLAKNGRFSLKLLQNFAQNDQNIDF
jgi:hypothetical protein